MIKHIKNFSNLILLLGVINAFGQENRYFIYFNQKGGFNYSYSLNEPSRFLTQKAIDRRSKEGIPIDSTDLPVNPHFINSLSDVGADVYFQSKWFNGALIQASEDITANISSLSFVDSVALIAEGIRLKNIKEPVEKPIQFEPPSQISAPSSDIQLWMLNANKMHNEGYKGDSVVIAVLDNGFRRVNTSAVFRHLWENNQLLASKDFVQNTGNVFQFGSHGTSVLSVIAGLYDTDTTSFSGIAPNARFILCITEENGSEDRVEEYNWLLGAEYADSLGVNIINSSLGYVDFDIPEHNYTYEDLDGKTMISTKAASMAASKGILVVNSAGNEGNRPEGSWRFLTAPADAEGILAVASVDFDFTRSSFSSIGPTFDGRVKPDIAALGNGVTLLNQFGDIAYSSGTSFSAPLITGFAAGVWQQNPHWTKEELIEAIKSSGHTSQNPSNELGFGVPNYNYLINGRTVSVDNDLETKIVVYPNPFDGESLFLSINEPMMEDLSIRMIDPKGKVVYVSEVMVKDFQPEIKLDLDSLQQGVYFLFLQSGTNKQVIQLINF